VFDDDNDGYVDNIYGIDAVNNDGDPMDDNNHGTHCAGTIGARANDGNPHVGVAWNVKLMGCKFLSGAGWGYTSGAIECVDWATANGAKVLSNSWGGGGFSQGLHDAIANARDQGVIFIAAAGNP
jgi:subtilisin family serine protease